MVVSNSYVPISMSAYDLTCDGSWTWSCYTDNCYHLAI